jgi:hypothetical protein
MGGLRRILLYGDSIVLGSVGASLDRAPQFELIRLPAAQPSVAELQACRPDAILFDIENGDPSAAFCLLENDPDLLLLGISPDVNLVRLWTSRQYRELSADALVALIADGAEWGSNQMPEATRSLRPGTGTSL